MYNRILFVDDDVLNHWVVTDALTALGFAVTGLCRGWDALAVLQEDDEFDLLLTEFDTPDGITGFELAEHWRRVRPGYPVLYTSDAPQIASGLLQSGEAFIRKHADTPDLLDVINALLEEAFTTVNPAATRRHFYVH